MNKINCTLLVDDDEATNYINELLIEELDFTEQLVVARNGFEALEMIHQMCKEGEKTSINTKREGCYPNLIFLDINMPVMDGFGFLEEFELLEYPGKSAVNIVMLTTSLNPDDIKKARKSDMLSFISKPLTEKTLSDLLHRLGIRSE